VGANYWATKHIRLTANYVLNEFPDASVAGSAKQRAHAPANGIAAGINDDARNHARLFHELLFRVAVAL
jgi:hypothetical protein